MERILEDIKTGQLKHVYLLYGEESYLIRQYRDRLRDALAEPGDEINVTRISGEDIDVRNLIDLAETMPFFADRRSIFLDDTGLFKKGSEELAEYMEEIPESTYLIFTETEVDKRTRTFKQAAKLGRAVDFKRRNEDELKRWILGRIRREDKQITRQVLELFLSRTGDDMDHIDTELEKLLCYTMGKDAILEEDVEAVCGSRLSDRIFDMVDAVAEKRQERAIELYLDLLLLKEAPMKILTLLTRQFEILLELKEMSREHVREDEMAERVGRSRYLVRKFLRQTGMFTDRQLEDAVRGGVQAEEDIKTGRMNDRLAVEMFLMEYSK